ncbi:hypothetical protein LPJ61_004609 [Coemansia biformis]|uniref:Uncharacterized protein n=1 Tax=Coemansia biformis TaxID=1286918 RepID=A0A9W7Y8Y4_9FUNG|nr:hypothetical protein LPJ61_004609 [Coemansia biformis]
MADKHPAHLLSAAATTTKGTAAPALQPADSPTAAQGPSTRASAHHLQAATLGRSGDLDRRSSADSTADMQVDHDAQYSVDMTSDAAAFATSNYRAGANGDDLLSLPPVRQSQSSEAPRPSAQGSHRTRGDSSPPPPGSAAHKLQPASAHSGQSEEDIRMSESPGLVTAAGYAVGEPTRRLPVRAPESTSPRPASTQRSQSSTRQEPDDDDDDDEDDDGDDDDGLKQSDGVTMPAKSALLYHAGYNSGRGAVWRFFRVVEARVSGNTDRAECLLCQKRMLGKSADMKKHIVGNCPNRSEISEDMQPILEIVKAELENPKKRAKRNSNTPITIRSDGSFAPVSSAYASAHADPSASSGRVHMASLRQTPPSARTPTHARPAPYDLHHHHHAHADAHRTKVSKYSR